jgi:hypothetical protein
VLPRCYQCAGSVLGCRYGRGDASNVKNAHIVPAFYLRAWEFEGKLTVRLDGKSLEMPAEKVGTRSRAYRRQRPNGDLINDVEDTLSQIEDDAAPLLATLSERWPVSKEEKSQLAVFFGFQIVRGPRWLSWADALAQAYAATQSSGDGGTATPPSTTRLLAMLSGGTQMTALVGTMHWSLLEFRSSVVATSDHPMVIWRQGVRAQRPTVRPFDVDDIACSEIRVPVSPRHAILMTWCDEPDDEAPRINCARHHAAALNAFTIAQAERQWFHRPGREPPRASGSLLPLAPQLLKGLNLNPREGLRRQAARSAVDEMGKKPLRAGKHPVSMYWLSRTNSASLPGARSTGVTR